MIKVFKYIPAIDAFIVEPKFKEVADYLGLSEWSEVVWIGRYFTLDNDFGEHWFDNWDERDKREAEAKKLGIAYEQILAIDPARFMDKKDGPCHSNEERKQFWTDVLMSLQLSPELIFMEAQKRNEQRRTYNFKSYLADLEERIEKTRASL